MLWQGQEIVENYDVPDSGPARIGTLRPVRWEYFYTTEGRSMIELVRKLLALRKNEEVFRKGSYYFHNNWDQHQNKGLLFFSRKINTKVAVVALNFSGSDQTAVFKFETSGNFIEQLHNNDNLLNMLAGINVTLTIPGNYGRVWINS